MASAARKMRRKNLIADRKMRAKENRVAELNLREESKRRREEAAQRHHENPSEHRSPRLVGALGLAVIGAALCGAL